MASLFIKFLALAMMSQFVSPLFASKVVQRRIGLTSGNNVYQCVINFALTDRENYLNSNLWTNAELDLVDRAIAWGRERYLASLKLASQFEIGRGGDPVTFNASLTHDEKEIISQIKILAMTSLGSRDPMEEISNIAYMAYAQHRFDDFVDRKDLLSYESILALEAALLSGDQKVILSETRRLLGGFYVLIDEMIDLAKDERRKQGVIKALWRITSGGLIQRADNAGILAEKSESYLQKSAADISDSGLKKLISKLGRRAYWMTTKTTLEGMIAVTDEEFDQDYIELLNIFYAPLLYYQDIVAETIVEGSSVRLFIKSGIAKKKIMAMLKSIRQYLELNVYIDDRKKNRIKQMNYTVLHCYGDLIPGDIFDLYVDILEAITNESSVF